MSKVIKKLLLLSPWVRHHYEEFKRMSIELAQKEDELKHLRKNNITDAYNQDGLTSIHNHDFMYEPGFVSAYERGMKAAGGTDYLWHWRVYIGLWLASIAVKREGDFVECGVNAGFMSSSIMHYLDWNSQNRTFYLLDTFSGIDSRFVLEEEIADSIMKKNENLKENGFYIDNLEVVKNNFSEWDNIKIIPGSVPETLTNVMSKKIAFLHIDMNCAKPECEALKYFWNRLSSGAPVLLDDYAYNGYHHQKQAIDELALDLGVNVLSLPTGQGLLIKN